LPERSAPLRLNVIHRDLQEVIMAPLTRSALLLIACFTGVAQASADKPAEKPRVKVEFRRAESKPAEGLTEAMVAGSMDKIYLHKMADATSEDIAEARSREDGQGKPAVEIIFTREGAKKMAKLSEQHKDRPLAILVDGKVIAAPIVRAKFSERSMITGNFTREEVDKLVKGINGK
jgi:preprotein translocase subunit SecD